jgi:hypothetical protein
MVFSKRNVLSAMAGLALLALPGNALAGHHHDHDNDDQNRPRPNAWHDQGWHNGWNKHGGDDGPFKNVRSYQMRATPIFPIVPRVAPVRRYEREGTYVPAPRWWGHREPDREDYPRQGCDEDGDYCRGYSEGAYNYQDSWGGYDYGPPDSYYDAAPPAGYRSSQQLGWLIQRRQQAYVVLARMRARGDRNAANRMLKVINNLNARIAQINRGTAGGYYGAPFPPVSDVPPVSPYTATPYGAGYGYNQYGATANPTVSPLGSIVGPLLGLPPY